MLNLVECDEMPCSSVIETVVETVVVMSSLYIQTKHHSHPVAPCLSFVRPSFVAMEVYPIQGKKYHLLHEQQQNFANLLPLQRLQTHQALLHPIGHRHGKTMPWTDRLTPCCCVPSMFLVGVCFPSPIAEGLIPRMMTNRSVHPRRCWNLFRDAQTLFGQSGQFEC